MDQGEFGKRFIAKFRDGVLWYFEKNFCDFSGSNVTVIPEEAEDMWQAYNLIAEGDHVRASTIRYKVFIVWSHPFSQSINQLMCYIVKHARDKSINQCPAIILMFTSQES